MTAELSTPGPRSRSIGLLPSQGVGVNPYDLIDHLLATEEVVLVREHPSLAPALRRAARLDRAVRLFPGAFVAPGCADRLDALARVVCRWDPQAVICGRAAAALSYWPQLPLNGPVTVASPHRHPDRPGFEFCTRSIPPTLVHERGGVRLTSPSLTAIDLATFDFTDPIDRALLSRQACLRSLQDALAATAGRRGNRTRRQLLLDSRAEPWSAAERLAHRIYRRAKITGWVTNHRVEVPGWGVYYLDIAFRRQRLAAEIDGLIHLYDRSVFEKDRLRQNALTLVSWAMMRFTYAMLDRDEDYVVRTTRRFLRLRG